MAFLKRIVDLLAGKQAVPLKELRHLLAKEQWEAAYEKACDPVIRDWQEARDGLRQAALGLKELAQKCLDEEDLENALPRAQKAADALPEDVEAAKLVSDIKHRTLQKQKADEHHEEVVKELWEKFHSGHSMGSLEDELDAVACHSPDIEALRRKLNARRKRVERYKTQARECLAAGDLAGAAKRLDQAREQYPRDPELSILEHELQKQRIAQVEARVARAWKNDGAQRAAELLREKVADGEIDEEQLAVQETFAKVRARAREEIVAGLRECLAAGALDRAGRELDKLERLSLSSESAQQLRLDFDDWGEARRLREQGDFEAAAEKLEPLGMRRKWPAVARELEECRSAVEKIAKLLRQAQEAKDNDDHEACQAACEAVLKMDPKNEEARRLLALGTSASGQTPGLPKTGRFLIVLDKIGARDDFGATLVIRDACVTVGSAAKARKTGEPILLQIQTPGTSYCGDITRHVAGYDYHAREDCQHPLEINGQKRQSHRFQDGDKITLSSGRVIFRIPRTDSRRQTACLEAVDQHGDWIRLPSGGWPSARKAVLFAGMMTFGPAGHVRAEWLGQDGAILTETEDGFRIECRQGILIEGEDDERAKVIRTVPWGTPRILLGGVPVTFIALGESGQ